jgi:hypothetical protein
MISTESMVVSSKAQISTNLSDEVVILNTENGVYYGLNPVGAYIWELIQEPTSVASLLKKLLDYYAIDETRCLNDLLAILNHLAKHGLIEVTG